MPVHVDAYLAGGIASGTVDRAGHLRDMLETGTELSLGGTSWQPLDGASPQAAGDMSVAVDDVLIAVSDDDPFLSMHAAWHGISLVVGPYLVAGELPTLPGFDPGRALTRPSGEFVMLRDVRLGLVGDDHETVMLAHALVNRYAVDRVSADIMLGFFFPGAALDATETTRSASRPAPSAAPAANAEDASSGSEAVEVPGSANPAGSP